MTTLELDGEQAARLARVVKNRRRELRMTQHEMALAGGLSVASLNRIENAKAVSVTLRTLDALDAGLRWQGRFGDQPGSTERVIAGGDPLPEGAPPTRVETAHGDDGAVRHRIVADLPEDEYDRLRRRWERVWSRVEDDPGRAGAVIVAAEAFLDALDGAVGGDR